MPFQNQVQAYNSQAVEGDFASQNPRRAVIAGPGGLVAGSNGVRIGRFGWLDTGVVDHNDAPAVVNSNGAGVPAGFVSCPDHTAVITSWLGESSLVIPRGLELTLWEIGDFWARNSGSAATVVGQVAFANTADGTVKFAAAGATVAGAVETKWICKSVGAVGELVKIQKLA